MTLNSPDAEPPFLRKLFLILGIMGIHFSLNDSLRRKEETNINTRNKTVPTIILDDSFVLEFPDYSTQYDAPHTPPGHPQVKSKLRSDRSM